MRINQHLIEMLEERLYQWALFHATGSGGCSTSPIYALMMTKVQNPRSGATVLIDDTAVAAIDSAMAAVKRESPEQYQVLSVEAFSLLGGDSLAMQQSRARRLRMSLRTYQRILERARIFLTGLLFGPVWNQHAEQGVAA